MRGWPPPRTPRRRTCRPRRSSDGMYAIPLGDDGAELRPLEPWHAEEFLAHLDRGREFINQYVPFGARATDVTGAREVLQRYADWRAADTASLHGLWLDDTLVGGVLTLNFDAANGSCEVGCWLEPAATGRGLVTRAMRVLIDWAVERRGIHRVEWVAASGNGPSIDVARRLGMTRDGVRREAHLHHGVRHDLEVWSVLAPEWRAAHEER
ncbi:GNAT family N-acetyltransferase [Streptomyces pimonensis]|uniref:GNAT family N-acetyltransferase n=1 Tax=Streptomyces pimonensis TaxID=2860288 RepID=A0ABV4J367_9ACTN